MGRKPYVERKAGLRNLLRGDRGIQYVEHAEEHGEKLFAAVCKLDLEGIVPKKLDSTYRGRPKLGSRSKIQNRQLQLAPLTLLTEDMDLGPWSTESNWRFDD